jgi:hypothetical protein
MLSIPWGRSLATLSPPAGLVGDEAIPRAAQPPGLIPGTLAACPAECTPRPRNLPAYRAACHAAQGEAVREFDAAEIVPDMRVWSGARFLTVAAVEHKRVADIKDVLATEAARAHLYVEMRLDGAEASGWLLAEPDAPVYCLA